YVNGTLTVNPAAGLVFPAGAQERQSAGFAPSDRSDHARASAPGTPTITTDATKAVLAPGQGWPTGTVALKIKKRTLRTATLGGGRAPMASTRTGWGKSPTGGAGGGGGAS